LTIEKTSEESIRNEKPNEKLSNKETAINYIDVNNDRDERKVNFLTDIRQIEKEKEENDLNKPKVIQYYENDGNEIERDDKNAENVSGNQIMDSNSAFSRNHGVVRLSFSSKYIEYDEPLAELTSTEKEYINQAKTFYSRKCRRRRIRRIREEEEGVCLTENEVVSRIREKSYALLERRERMLKKYY